MGEITEMVLEGVLCEGCGSLMEDMIPRGNKKVEAPGYPRRCEDCTE